METAEYHNLDLVEREHWYYAGKRELVHAWIDRVRPVRRNDTWLDFGAGTGIFALSMRERCRVLALDAFPESRALLARHFPTDQILAPEGDRIPLADASIAGVSALDVLEHIEDDQGAVAEIHRVLEPGGIFVGTVPADMRLWSDWDEALHHVRRYNRDAWRALFSSGDWNVAHLAFTNVLAYPAVYAIRRLRRNRMRNAPSAPRSEDRVPARPMNWILRRLFVATGKARWLDAPFGVSLIVVATKRDARLHGSTGPR
ncbi:class I SAM-dependent methyltransferase [Opitutales bacterium ASA1]|uniref:class I SAM-dependent methyltransferase n=1 Tax=Congregicoccus parvus TaxID=3081749 RepID=UPI002B2B9E06|nr:class I SAM-dependent methyltransferase [Opitutales bacterium ASA1]